MKKLVLITFVLLFLVSIAAAFEIDGFKSGMTQKQAKSHLAKYWYGSVEVKGDKIAAYPQSMDEPLIVLQFRKGLLYRYETRYLPNIVGFARFVEEKRMEFGKPYDAWFGSTNTASNNDIDHLEFLWKKGKSNCRLSYSQNEPSSRMTITFEDVI